MKLRASITALASRITTSRWWSGADQPVYRYNRPTTTHLILRAILVLLAAAASYFLMSLRAGEAGVSTSKLIGLGGGWALVLLMAVWPKSIPIIGAITSALVVAFCINNLSYVQVLVGFAAILLSVVFIKRVDIGVIVIVIMIASIMHQNAIPKPVTVGEMGFDAAELFLLILFGVVLFQAGGEKRLDVFNNPIGTCLLLLLAAIPLSMIVSYHYHLENPQVYWSFKDVYTTARPLVFYLGYFVVVAAIRSERQLKTVVVGVIVVAVVVALLMVIQYFLGTHVKLFFGSEQYAPRVEELSDQARGVTRSIPPGVAIMSGILPIVMYLACVGTKKLRLLYAMAGSILTIGLIFTFTRSVWSSVFVAIVFIWILAGKQVKWRMASITMCVLPLGIGAAVLFGTLAPGSAGQRFTSALTERVGSIFEGKTMLSSSIQWRVYENRTAMEMIKDSPILGVGVGVPQTYKISKTPDGNTYSEPRFEMHNSYLDLWLSYGILGVLSFLAITIVALVRSITLFFSAKDDFLRAVALGSGASFLAYLIKSNVSMTILHEPFSITSCVLIWGFIEVAWRLHRQKSAESKDELPEMKETCLSPR